LAIVLLQSKEIPAYLRKISDNGLKYAQEMRSRIIVQRASPSVNTSTHPQGLLIGNHRNYKSRFFEAYMACWTGRFARGRNQNKLGFGPLFLWGRWRLREVIHWRSISSHLLLRVRGLLKSRVVGMKLESFTVV
jgi:hypothetical protein